MSRWLLLKREENLKAEQRFRLRDLLRYTLKTVRAYLLNQKSYRDTRLAYLNLGRCALNLGFRSTDGGSIHGSTLSASLR